MFYLFIYLKYYLKFYIKNAKSKNKKGEVEGGGCASLALHVALGMNEISLDNLIEVFEVK